MILSFDFSEMSEAPQFFDHDHKSIFSEILRDQTFVITTLVAVATPFEYYIFYSSIQANVSQLSILCVSKTSGFCVVK